MLSAGEKKGTAATQSQKINWYKKNSENKINCFINKKRPSQKTASFYLFNIGLTIS